MPNRLALAALACAALSSTTGFAQIKTELVASGFTNSIYLTAPENDAERLFLVERDGVIRIIENGSLLSEPFLDIRAIVEATAPPYEMGLLGLAFDPEYETKGHFYVYYTPKGAIRTSVVDRYTVSANPDSADENSAHRIFQIDQPSAQHNGGTVLFGPDGYLYLGLGESNSPARAQDPLELLGKMLRINPNRDDFPSDSLQNYGIPSDNPFVDSLAVRDEIWAFGLRNPYRFNFDSATGDLYIGDVGKDAREEIDFQPAGSAGGENYGWPHKEGTFCFDPPVDCDDPSFTDPIHDYGHGACGCVVGGSVYRGSAIPAIEGLYFFADFCEAKIWSARVVGGAFTELTDRSEELKPEGAPSPIGLVTAIEEGGDGELYIVKWTFSNNGAVYKIVPDTSAVDAAIAAGARGPLQFSNGSPNPFERATRFELRHRAGGDVRVSVYSAAGRFVRTLYEGRASTQPIVVEWKGHDAGDRAVAPGVYFVRAETAEHTLVRRVTFVR